jgi:hypothetical protein
MRTLSLVVAVMTVVVAEAGTASAQDREQRSFRNLVSNNYEIKNVAVVPNEIAKRYAENTTTDTVLVTLQRGKSIAVCYFSFASWVTLPTVSLEDTSRCEVRTLN